MEWPYSECGGDSDLDEDSNADPHHSSGLAFNIEQTEVVNLEGQELALPKGLCAQPEIFWEFFSMEHLWNELPADTRDQLKAQFLPNFPVPDNDQEKEETIQRLFNRSCFRFNSSPLDNFQRDLEDGKFLPDMIKYRKRIAKSERHERRYQECEYISRVARKLVESRKALLARTTGRLDTPQTSVERDVSKALKESVTTKARKRYLNEIASISSEMNLPLSDSDEEASLLEHYSAIHNNNNYRAPRKPGRPPLIPAANELLTESGELKFFSTFAYKPKLNGIATNFVQKSVFDDHYLRDTLRKHRKRKTKDAVSLLRKHCRIPWLF